MSDANNTQVGGNHYKTESERGNPQHWDLAIMYQWDPFQYQVTKYIMRWKTKHSTPAKKLEDLKKARHFLDKYIENYEKYLPPQDEPELPFKSPGPEFLKEPPATSSNEFWTNEGFYGDGTCLFKCRACGSTVRRPHTPLTRHLCPAPAAKTAPDASEPRL